MTVTISKASKSLVATDTPIIFCATLARVFEVSGALLLQQLHYWNTNMPSLVEGESWHYESARKLADTLGVFTEQTVRKKLKMMENMGVLHVGVFNKKKYDRTRWYRINYTRLAEVLTEQTGKAWCSIPLPSGNEYRIHEVLSMVPIPKSVLKSSKDLKDAIEQPPIAESPPAEPAQALAGKNKPDYLSTLKGDTPMATAAEIMMKHKHQSSTKTFEATATGLSSLWKNRLGLVYGGFTKPLTGKEVGQLKLYAKAVQAMHGDAVAALDWALQHWGEYAYEVKKVKALASVPAQPQTGFVLSYPDVLLQLIAKNTQNTFDKPVPVVHTPIQATKAPEVQKPSLAPAAEDAPVSEDAVLASLKMFQ